MIRTEWLSKIVFSTLLVLMMNFAEAQTNPQQTFYYNPRGFSYVPPLNKPSIIYMGKLFVGTRQLNDLFAHVNNKQLTDYFIKYKKNRTTATVFSLVGVGLSIYSIADRVSGSDRKFNWYTFGGGIACSLGSGFFNSKANQHLLNAAIVFDEATKQSGFVPAQSNISISIPLSK